ncbi:MAG TPA: SDR family NAD(P)-dependent oxidoreductase, partial [Devosia sp.]|nr:SDR family NAD(P)-dependent oxidoreductase [Devosia sp.]
MDLNLRDKVAVITGGTVGIGLAVAEGLAAEGANLVLVGRNRQRGDDESARIADKHGIIATAVSADVATATGCAA